MSALPGAAGLYAKASADFADKLTQTERLLHAAELEYAPLTQASSLGAEDMVVTHLLHEQAIESAIFVLDTGKLHAETRAMVGRIEKRYGRPVEIYHPIASEAAAFEATHGTEAMYRSFALRKACCDIRKMEPLERALQGKRGWITGLRRDQSGARAQVDAIETQEVTGIDGQRLQRAKINPLARWTWGDVWHYIALHKIPYNPLHDQFFPSIGCAPCTRAVTLGEDFRSGRWWWEQESAKECGLHVAPASSSIIPIKEVA